MGMRSGTGCSRCLGLLFVIFNFILLLVGLALIIVGIWVRFGANETIKPLVEEALKQLRRLPMDYHIIGNQQAAQTALPEIDIGTICHEACIAIIVVGAIMVMMAVIGLAGTCCRQTGLLVIYAILLLLFIIAQLVVICLFWFGMFDDQIKRMLFDGLRNNYGSLIDTSKWSILLNFMMVRFQCCGINNYLDFQNQGGTWGGYAWVQLPDTTSYTHRVQMKLELPLACCKLTGKFPNAVPITPDMSCATTSAYSSSVSNYNMGCWGSINQFLMPHKTLAIALMAGLLFFQFLLWLLPVLMLCLTKDDSDDDDRSSFTDSDLSKDEKAVIKTLIKTKEGKKGRIQNMLQYLTRRNIDSMPRPPPMLVQGPSPPPIIQQVPVKVPVRVPVRVPVPVPVPVHTMRRPAPRGTMATRYAASRGPSSFHPNCPECVAERGGGGGHGPRHQQPYTTTRQYTRM